MSVKEWRSNPNGGLRPFVTPKRNLRFPQFEKPMPVGFFSVDTSRNYEPSASKLRYCNPPTSGELPLDLNAGIELMIKKPDSANDERLDKLLCFIFDKQRDLIKTSEEGYKKLDAAFVCWRGLLRLLMCTPYETESWCIHVTRYRGTFYMCVRDTEEARQQRANETPRQRQCCAWGRKFEQYCLSESPSQKPQSNGPIDECSEFSCVFKSFLEGVPLLYGAEMDGILSEKPVNLDYNNTNTEELANLKHVELKVRAHHGHPRQERSYKRYKTRNWWCQSFLVNIDTICLGLRRENGQLDKVEYVDVCSVRKEGEAFWSAAVCMRFLVDFMEYVEHVVKNTDDPYTTFQFRFDGQRITYAVTEGKNVYSFLPEWYIDVFKTVN